MSDLSQTAITQLTGVADKQAARLARLGLYSVLDLLLHFPLRYEDRTQLQSIGAINAGQSAIIEGEILLAEVIPGRRRMLVARVSDGTGSIDIRFFNFYGSQVKQLARGTRVQCYGEVRRGRQRLEMIHPEYRIMTEGASGLVEQQLTPIYPITDGIKQLSMRKLVSQALALMHTNQPDELLPDSVKQKFNIAPIELVNAISFLHQPSADADLALLSEGEHPVQKRLAIEELLAHQISMLQLKQQNQQHRALQLQSESTSNLQQQFLQSLSFTPTEAQLRVTQELQADMQQPVPMMRLVQGDVGSGKTLVAALAALRAIEAGYQVALMAPTELLAEQHLANFSQWFKALGIELAWLAGKVTGKARNATLTAIANGEAQLVIGTHALFQQAVEFKALALMIIDEQHRFGVEQRLALQQKAIDGTHPHQLVMTATPIPRTLAMSIYADMDTSVIDELPPGRTPVTTVALSNERRTEVIERIRHSCVEQQRQVYWVCTLIEESEKLNAEAAEQVYELLKGQLPELKVALVHGRLKAPEKLAIMQAFKAGEIDLLVATTVIEVGVDVPNASLMVIENAERLGLAQLHQLRGRVGRGSTESHCVLLYQTPLSAHGKARLTVMRESTDGFYIAEKDLELRGPGEVLGTRQTGIASFKVADLYRDRLLLPTVRDMAQQLLNEPSASGNCQALIDRWLGHKTNFAKV